MQRTNISVVIPTCHRNDMLAKCLDCLSPGVQQLEASRYEVVVSDDGSKTTAQFLVEEHYPWAKWVTGPRRGPAANRNNGARHARGEWIAFTDDDCQPEPQWLLAFEQARVSHPDTAVWEGKTTTEQRKDLFLTAPANLHGGYLWSCNMMIRKTDFEALQGFDERFPFPHLEDVEFYLRLKKSGYKAPFVPKAVVFHPLRPLSPIWRQSMANESAWYMSRKHDLKLRYFQIHPLLFWKSQLRTVVRSNCSVAQALRYLIFRTSIEAFLLCYFAPRWNKKYPRS